MKKTEEPFFRSHSILVRSIGETVVMAGVVLSMFGIEWLVIRYAPDERLTGAVRAVSRYLTMLLMLIYVAKTVLEIAVLHGREVRVYTALMKLIRPLVPQQQTTTAIAAVASSRRKSRMAATTILGGSLLGYIGVNFYSKESIDVGVLSVLLGGLVVLQIGALAMNYRVYRGLYGTNAYEAREIIRFVLENADHADLSGGLGASDSAITPASEIEAHHVWAGVTA